VPYYNCGKTWYTEGYASSGPVYMPVPPPPGYWTLGSPKKSPRSWCPASEYGRLEGGIN